VPDIVAGIVSTGFLVPWIYGIYDVVVTGDAFVKLSARSRRQFLSEAVVQW
jgi:hypothetical protein